jgi:osmotically-inducible protein OsmY
LLGLSVALGCDNQTANRINQDINKSTGTDKATDGTTDKTTVEQSSATKTSTTTDDEGPPKPDNSAVNKRDNDSNAKTPIDQSEDQANVNKTAEIRRRVVDLPDLSVNARHVKIITDPSGKVTLRGPVESQAEHDAIVKIAKDVAGNEAVDDQIDVKADK